jgi:membrane peptidoglycan carboxypeptidase
MISPYVVEAVLTTEDGKFMGHKGVTLPEIQRAIELNLEKRKLSHGASTITMQLAKNLFLARERTVSRKLEELFFTWYLESYFRKEEILELYLNVIEFGPSIYGIADASHHYFGREPHELNLAESVFLVKLLPSPVARHDAYEQGAVTERRMNALHKVMRTMFERDRISRAELEQGLSETIDFYLEGEPLPEPRVQVPLGAPALAPDDGQTADDETSETDWGF